MTARNCVFDAKFGRAPTRQSVCLQPSSLRCGDLAFGDRPRFQVKGLDDKPAMTGPEVLTPTLRSELQLTQYVNFVRGCVERGGGQLASWAPTVTQNSSEPSFLSAFAAKRLRARAAAIAPTMVGHFGYSRK